jgi:hypothetical protein
MIAEFVRRLVRRTYTRDDAPGQPHHLLATPVVAQSVDEQLRPISEPFKLVLQDVSLGGVRLLHTAALTQYLIIQLINPDSAEQEPISVAIELFDCRQVGPIFQTGGRFLTELPRSLLQDS